MYRLRLTAPARDDIVDVLIRSEEAFGTGGRRRYDALITKALRDVAADPSRPGCRDRSDLAPGVHSYHVLNSRERARTPQGIVRNPRHVLIYHFPDQQTVEILRVLHDAMDPDRHLP